MEANKSVLNLRPYGSKGFESSFFNSSSSTLDSSDLPEDQKVRLLKKINGILNKLTPQNFYYLKVQILYSGITTADLLVGVISLIFNYAVLDRRFCPMYAQLFSDLYQNLPVFSSDEPGGKGITTKSILLNNCQELFESAFKMEAENEEFIKLRVLGNIRLIAELVKIRMVPEKIVHYIVLKLLGLIDDNKISQISPKEENVEAICLFFQTVGKHLNNCPKSRLLVDLYFNRLKRVLASDIQLAPRIRFMALDVIDLRANNWISRKKECLVTEIVDYSQLTSGCISISRTKLKPCTKFFSTSGCRFGENCHFLHYFPGGYDAVANLLKEAPIKNGLRCCNFKTVRGCKYGDKCMFVHGGLEL